MKWPPELMPVNRQPVDQSLYPIRIAKSSTPDEDIGDRESSTGISPSDS
jgi:hypothetical protein